MFKQIIYLCIGVVCISLTYTACTPTLIKKTANTWVPASYNSSVDTSNMASIKWKEFFTDPYLTDLIDTALKNNQELNITLQEIAITQNEVRARKGEYLPFVDATLATGVEKVGRYTSQGANDANTEIEEGKKIPDPLPEDLLGVFASWEVDIWHKLRNAKKSAYFKYLSSIEGKNFVQTNLIAEIAYAYYELLALDNQLEIIQQNIDIQSNALKIVKFQKEAARATELAVRRFEAEVLNTRSLQYDIRQKIMETENRINFLTGKYPQPVPRNSKTFTDLVPKRIQAGIPAQLLSNRPDLKQAEMELSAAKLDVEVARANFYPRLSISAGLGFQAFNPAYLVKTPESMLYSLVGDLTAPLINRNAIKATYYTANAKQIQAVYNYEQTILNAYIEVANQLSMINNLENSYDLKSRQVEALNASITISNDLFKSARADYMEVLLTQRDALESKFELIETKSQQMKTMVNIYRTLGGGWN